MDTARSKSSPGTACVQLTLGPSKGASGPTPTSPGRGHRARVGIPGCAVAHCLRVGKGGVIFDPPAFAPRARGATRRRSPRSRRHRSRQDARLRPSTQRSDSWRVIDTYSMHVGYTSTACSRQADRNGVAGRREATSGRDNRARGPAITSPRHQGPRWRVGLRPRGLGLRGSAGKIGAGSSP